MKKNNTAEKTIQNAKKLTEALKESTKKSLKDIMNEAISNIIMQEDDEENELKDDNLEDSYEVEDVETNDETPANTDDIPTDGEGEDADADATDADDEWSDMEEFKVGDNDYDFTGVDGETVLKVYNKLGDDDQIFVKKDEEGNYEVKDNETGAEYVIELNADTDEADSENAEIGDDTESETDLDIDLGDGDTDAIADKLGNDDNAEDDALDIEIEDDDENKNDEDLNEGKNMIVNDYQKKNPIDGLKMNEPADSSATYSMDGGAPKGTERPYGKRGDDCPFVQKVNEGKECPKCGKENCECNKDDEKVNECGNTATADQPVLDEDGTGLNTKHSTKKNTNHINRSAQNQRHVSTDGDYQALKEAAIKIYNKAKLIQEENNKYKDCIKEIKNSLKEAAVLNVSLAQVVKLIMENSTSASEKKSILERFNNVKTIKESKDLYNTIKGELNEAKKSEVVLERQLSAAPGKTLNETTIYHSKQDNPALDLMKRMDNLWKN